MQPAARRRNGAVRRACAMACGAGLLAGLCAATAVPAATTWVIDPAVPGDDLPPVGRSLFDHLMMVERQGVRHHDIPNSFVLLRKRIEDHVQPDARAGVPGLKQVLIPLGRSLQRLAASPSFFASPRIVLAVDEAPALHAGRSGLLLKDRLYLGYQPRTGVLEVISYNEAAGRFEFQVVKDFQPGGDPKVFYANRRLCTSCHQNAAAIFSRPTWDETNANPAVAAMLSAHAGNFEAVSVHRGVDVPNAIDDATDRANLLSTYQLLWRDGCGGTDRQAPDCRASLFVAALQYRLSGLRQYDRQSPVYRQHVLGTLLGNARDRWPAGLWLPNPDLPNRDPMSGHAEHRDLVARAGVAAAFDPLLQRAPLATWRADDDAFAPRAVAGLGESIADTDIVHLDVHLARQARRGTAMRRSFAGPCEVTSGRTTPRSERLQFDCAPPPGPARAALRLSGEIELVDGVSRPARLRRLQLGEQGELRELELGQATSTAQRDGRSLALTLHSAGRTARGADGDAIGLVELRWSGSKGLARAVVIDDFAPVMAAVQSMLQAGRQGRFDGFDALPFRRARLMPALFERLGMPALNWCCLDTTGMPAPRLEPDATGSARDATAFGEALAPGALGFFARCASCHATADRARRTSFPAMRRR
jgi:hypothetical protein